MDRTAIESTDGTEFDFYLPATPDLEMITRAEALLRRLLGRRGSLRRVVRPKY